MASNLITSWLKFFREAGIQNNTSAALYATTFAENEVEIGMVGDLNREILKEMGITLMGHVLAILKHAHQVHNEAEKCKIVAKTSYPSPSKGIVNPFAQTSVDVHPKKNEPAHRLIEHYTRPSELTHTPVIKRTVATIPSTTQVATKFTQKPQISTKPVTKGLKVTDRLGIMKNAGSGIQRTTALKTTNHDVVPVKKIRRVLPEQEGGYKIKMPSGTTPKTKQLLAKGGSQKATVFARLGASDSSSEPDNRKVTITGVGEPVVKAGGSVFSRLGGRQAAAETTASIATTSEQPVQERLGYRGILKTPATSTAKATGQVSSTTGKLSAKSRLGQSPLSTVSSSAKTDSGATKTITKRKKFVLVKKSGLREIVYRDVVQEVPAPPKRTTFDAATRNKFRSGNIAVVPSISSRLGQEQEEQEWDY